MANIDDLAAAQRARVAAAASGRASVETTLGAEWMILKKDTQFGPYTLDDLRRLVDLGSVDSETKAWREGLAEWVPINKILTVSASKSPVGLAEKHETLSYQSPIAAEPRKSIGFISRYRRRVGHRSFIFQLWLLAWTFFYVGWIVSLWASASSHASSPPPGMPPFNPAPTPFSLEDVLAGATSGWLCVAAGWAVVGLPVGIAAVATMEDNQQ
jgi:GYF domain 2